MVEDLNGYFSSVFTRENINSLLVPKLLMETVEQIGIPLARVFNLSLKEGVVPFEWKEANTIPLFKKSSRNKSKNYREVSNWKSVLSGAPQGSVLGPLLFLIYISYLDDDITSNVLKFPDDTKVF